MRDLERELRALAGAIEYPPTPSLTAGVVAELRSSHREHPAAARKRLLAPARLAVGLALLTATSAAVLAGAPAARELASDLLGLSEVRIERVPEAPEVEPHPPQLGPEVSLQEAQRVADFGLLVPAALGPPDSTHINPRVPGGQVSLAYRPRAGLPEARETSLGLLLTEVRGDLVGEFIRKLVSPQVEIRRLRLFGERAVWIAGEPHLVAYEGAAGFAEARLRLATNTLLLQRGGVLVRIEAEIDRRRAIEIARSLRGTDRPRRR